MDESQLRQIAGQCRQPQGEAGIEVGQRMNVGNELINRRAIAQLSVQPGDRVLEIGPGNGFFARAIVGVAASVHYVGCDLSVVMVEQADQMNADLIETGQCRFVLRDGPTLPFADDSFDKLLTVNTLYFWNDPAAELTEIRRVLVPGGLLVIGIRPRWVMAPIPFVQYGFTTYEPDEVAALLTAHGFQHPNIFVEPEPDHVFFGESTPMATALICGRT